jgi:hypothetical protein
MRRSVLKQDFVVILVRDGAHQDDRIDQAAGCASARVAALATSRSR